MPKLQGKDGRGDINMENYLMLNGKRIDLTEEQVKTLTAEEKKNPFERNRGKAFFFIGVNGFVKAEIDTGFDMDNEKFDAANYCTDKAMMEQRALHETLNRLLWRYSEEHGGDVEWDGENKHWLISRRKNGVIEIENQQISAKTHGVVYFKDRETTQSAIEEIVNPFMEQHQEFVW